MSFHVFPLGKMVFHTENTSCHSGAARPVGEMALQVFCMAALLGATKSCSSRFLCRFQMQSSLKILLQSFWLNTLNISFALCDSAETKNAFWEGQCSQKLEDMLRAHWGARQLLSITLLSQGSRISAHTATLWNLVVDRRLDRGHFQKEYLLFNKCFYLHMLNIILPQAWGISYWMHLFSHTVLSKIT